MADRVEIAGQSPAWVFRAIEEAHRQALAKVERDAARWRRAHEIVEAERDQTRESLRRLRDETDFDLFTVRDQLKQCRGEREQMTRDRDEWKARAEAAERERDEALEQARAASIGWMNAADHAEAAETRTAPAVTKADIEKAVAEWVDDAPEIVNEVWSLVSGADPAVHVVRESDIAAPAVTRDDIDRALINVTSNAMNYPTPAQILGKDTEPLRRKCVDAICDLLCIEADQGVDPMEAGQALWEAVWGHKHPPSAWFEIGQGLREEYALIEAHIARQEARDA